MWVWDVGLMSPLLSASVTSDEVPGPLAAGTLMRTDKACLSFPCFQNQALQRRLCYVVLITNEKRICRHQARPAYWRGLCWKTKRRSSCLSAALSVVRVAQPDRLGRRSSTFTLPPCQTSRAVLENEVAISYCSVKHLKLSLHEEGGEGDQTGGSSCCGGKMN